MKAAGIDPVVLERQRQEAGFRPYIHVICERTVPTQITFFAISGGFERWATIKIPLGILALPLEEQLSKLPQLMADFVKQYPMVLFLGAPTGFVYVRYRDHFRFNRDGKLVERVDEPFYRGAAWVELR